MFSTKATIPSAVAVFTDTVAVDSGPMTYFYSGLGACGCHNTKDQAVFALNSED
ncbi:hypothetical protein GGR50DRAFT_698822 [Xylaria sp. CBS 124048]|nr:hypothetical protein GGR50DRAFT_698822 [Xylaria sp. CBS 124048]